MARRDTGDTGDTAIDTGDTGDRLERALRQVSFADASGRQTLDAQKKASELLKGGFSRDQAADALALSPPVVGNPRDDEATESFLGREQLIKKQEEKLKAEEDALFAAQEEGIRQTEEEIATDPRFRPLDRQKPLGSGSYSYDAVDRLGRPSSLHPSDQRRQEEEAERKLQSVTRLITEPGYKRRSEALQRRFDYGDERKRAEVAEKGSYLRSKEEGLEEAKIEAEGAKGRFLPGDETGKYGRFGTPTPPESGRVRRMEGPDFSGLAAMEEELADRGAWLKSHRGDLDPASAAAGEHTQGPDYAEALREYNDLKREVEQKQREIAAFKIQDAGLQQDYSVGPSKEATEQAAQDYSDRQELIKKIEQAGQPEQPERKRRKKPSGSFTPPADNTAAFMDNSSEGESWQDAMWEQ
jgi:hypothetical protein